MPVRNGGIWLLSFSRGPGLPGPLPVDSPKVIAGLAIVSRPPYFAVIRLHARGAAAAADSRGRAGRARLFPGRRGRRRLNWGEFGSLGILPGMLRSALSLIASPPEISMKGPIGRQITNQIHQIPGRCKLAPYIMLQAGYRLVGRDDPPPVKEAGQRRPQPRVELRPSQDRTAAGAMKTPSALICRLIRHRRTTLPRRRGPVQRWRVGGRQEYVICSLPD